MAAVGPLGAIESRIATYFLLCDEPVRSVNGNEANRYQIDSQLV